MYRVASGATIMFGARHTLAYRFTGRILAVCLLFSMILATGPGLAFAGPVRSLQEIRQEGVVIQKWDTSCGAAALATVLTYSLQDPVSGATSPAACWG
jgi:hypothetical protein